MLVKDAIKLCPNLVIVEPNHQLYSYYSKKFFDYLYTITKKQKEKVFLSVFGFLSKCI